MPFFPVGVVTSMSYAVGTASRAIVMFATSDPEFTYRVELVVMRASGNPSISHRAFDPETNPEPEISTSIVTFCGDADGRAPDTVTLPVDFANRASGELSDAGSLQPARMAIVNNPNTTRNDDFERIPFPPGVKALQTGSTDVQRVFAPPTPETVYAAQVSWPPRRIARLWAAANASRAA